MYIRFLINRLDPDSHRRQGLFNAAYELQQEGDLSGEELDSVNELLKWFKLKLDIPDRFSRSRRPSAHGNAICWFKDTAVDCLARARQLVDILTRHGVLVEMVTTVRPGYIVYEDEHQIAAVPFRETEA